MRLSFVRLNIVALTLCAVLLRGLLPAGWMPSVQGAGGGLVICTADGTHRAEPQHSPAQHAPNSKHDNAVCPYAASAHFAAIQNPPQVSATLTAFYATPSAIGVAIPEQRFRNRDHPARAPPFLV